MRRLFVIGGIAVVAAGCGGGGGSGGAGAQKPGALVCRATRVPGYTVCGYPLQPRRASSIWTSFGRSAVRLTGPAEAVPGDRHPAGFWVPERLFLSPDRETLLAQWSGQCEAQSAYLVSVATGKARSILEPSAESSAIGWTPAGKAKISVPRGACGSSHLRAGIYAVDRVTLRPTLLKRLVPKPGGP